MNVLFKERLLNDGNLPGQLPERRYVDWLLNELNLAISRNPRIASTLYQIWNIARQDRIDEQLARLLFDNM